MLESKKEEKAKKIEASKDDNPSSKGKDHYGDAFDETHGYIRNKYYNINDDKETDWKETLKYEERSKARKSKYEDKKWWSERCLYDFFDPVFLIKELRHLLYSVLKPINFHFLVFILELGFWLAHICVWLIYILIKFFVFPFWYIAIIYIAIVVLYIMFHVHKFYQLPGNFIKLVGLILYSVFFICWPLIKKHITWPTFLLPIVNLFKEIFENILWKKVLKCTCFNGNCRPQTVTYDLFWEYFIYGGAPPPNPPLYIFNFKF